MALLEIENLHVSYGSVEVLHGISLHVDEGEIVTLLGANGAGKSTTLLSISRLVNPPGGPHHLRRKESSGLRELSGGGPWRSPVS